MQSQENVEKYINVEMIIVEMISVGINYFADLLLLVHIFLVIIFLVK